MLHEIDADLKTAEATLKHWEVEYPKRARIAARARLKYDLAWANAVTGIAAAALDKGEKPPTLPVQEAMATKQVESQMARARLAEQDLDIAKKLIGIAETTLSSIQTRAGLERIEAGLAR